MAKVYLKTHATHFIPHGAELGGISSTELDGYQCWSLSELLGIRRKGKASNQMEGEVTRICIYSDYDGPTWSQLRMRNAMVTYRSIMTIDKTTIPRKTMEGRGDNNVLYKNIVKK